MCFGFYEIWGGFHVYSGFHVIATTSRYHLVATTCQTLSTTQGCCTSEEQAVAMLRKGGGSYIHDFLSNDTYKRRRKAGRTNGLTCTYVGVFCVLAFLTWYARSAKKLHVVPMPRVPAGSLTKKEFFEQYGDQAVIIEGGLRQHPAVGLGLEGLRDLCGGATVETYVFDPKSDEWGGHVDQKLLKFDEYIDEYILNETNLEKRYFPGGLVGMPIVCPVLENLTPVLSYFTVGYRLLSHEPEVGSDGKAHQLVSHQPELFVGPGGTKTEMHMDSYPGTFWMSVYFGKKMFRTISYEDSIKYMPYYKNQKNLRWEKEAYSEITGQKEKRPLEIWNPDLKTFPELAKVTIWEGTVNAGDWLYLPPATLHGVYNPEPFWALTSMDIYPPLFDKFIDVCVDTNFMGRCQQSILEIGQNKCDPRSLSREDLKKCLRDSPYVQSIQKQYDDEQQDQLDKFLHEMADYDSFETWCDAICTRTKKDKNGCQACDNALKVKSSRISSH